MTMPSLRTARSRRARLAVVLGIALILGPAARAQRIPDRLDDATFWRMMTDYSETWGVFRSENFVSNETSLQWVIPELQRVVKPGGVYLGVAPDQNFTYIAAVKPGIAFIVDIRHQNAVEHLMYKALIETSNTRAEFLAKLFARPALTGVDSASTAPALFDALANVKPDSAIYRSTLQAIKDRLIMTHGFALSDSELVSLNCVYGAFFTYGAALSYNHSSDCRNPGPFTFGRGGRPGGGGGGMGGAFGMPSFLSMMLETDGAAVDRSYLATEANFRTLRNMEERNLIVPLTGNFAGDKAVRAAGRYARDHGAIVTTFYLSNVEQYLFQQDDEAQRFYRNVATLPLDSTSTFIRSFSGGMYNASGLELKPQSGRSMQLLSSILATLKAFDAGALTSWVEVVRRSRQ